MYNFRTLVFYEYKKLFKRKIVWITLLALIVINAASVILAPFLSSVSSSTEYYTYYEADKWEKELTKDLNGRPIDDAMLKEARTCFKQDALSLADSGTFPHVSPDSDVPASIKYDDIYQFVSLAAPYGQGNQAYERFHPGTADEIYSLLKAGNLNTLNDLQLTRKESDYMKDQIKNISTPFVYQYSKCWSELLELMSTIEVLILFLTAVCVPQIFSDEHARRTDQLIQCTRFGRGPVYAAKLFTGISFSTLSLLFVFLSGAVPAFILWGSSGFQTQIQLIYPPFPWNLTIGEALIILLFLCLVSAVLNCCAALFLAEKFKSSLPAMCILIGFLLLSLFLNIPEQIQPLARIWNYRPASMVSLNGAFTCYPASIFGFCFPVWLAAIGLYLILILLFAVWGYRIYSRWQAGGR